MWNDCDGKCNKLALQYFEAIEAWTIVSKTDINWNITYANDKFCEISWYSRQELIWKYHNIIRHPDMPDEIFARLWDTIKNKKQPFWWTIKNKKKDGSHYWVRALVKPILDNDWNILEFISLREDITKEKEYEEKLKKQNDFIKYAFGKYLSENIIKKIIKEDKLSTEFEKKNITVMFIDMQDFTYLTDVYWVEKIAEISSIFFKHVVRYVQKHAWSVDKYIWDNVMCLRNWFEDDCNHILNASKAAVDIIKNISEFDSMVYKLINEKINIRIWISTGECLVWNVWTDVKFDYTAIWPAVNFASRLEWANKRFWTNILIDEICNDNIKNYFDTKFMWNISIRWFHKKVNVYSLNV